MVEIGISMVAIPSDLLAELTRFISANSTMLNLSHHAAMFRGGIGAITGGCIGAFASKNSSTFLDKKNQSELDKAISFRDESFVQMLIRKIREKQINNSECYTKARIDRRLFSKIISNPQYKIQKKTVYAFALALELSIDETSEMLLKAGFGLSNSQIFDLIIKFFIEKNIYDIELINAALYHYDQPLLGD